MSAPDFWNNRERAQADVEEVSRLRGLINPFHELERELDDFETAIVRCDRRHHLAAVLGEIFHRENAAARRYRRDDVLGDATLIERGGPVRRNGLQGLGQRRKPQHLAGLRGAALDEEMPRGAGVAAQPLDER